MELSPLLSPGTVGTLLRPLKTCNAEAAGKKGQERKDFMKSCLSNGQKQQQERMKMCAAQNKGKKGDEYKKAQSDCLKKG